MSSIDRPPRASVWGSSIGRLPFSSICQVDSDFDDEAEEKEDQLDTSNWDDADPEDESFDPEPTDDEIWNDFDWDEESDDNLPPPDELWSDADWE